jgi:hypothetical protein
VNVGTDLAAVYWEPGNRAQFLDLVQALTGAPLSAAAWVASLNTPVEERVSAEREAYAQAVETGPRYKAGDEVGAELGMRVLLVHGDEVVADSGGGGGLWGACAVYKQWLTTLK